MSDTPETDAEWLISAKVESVEAECMLRKIAEKLERERDDARREAEEFRDDMRIHLTEGPGTFSWENAPDQTP